MNVFKQRRFAEPPHAPSRQTGACCEAPLAQAFPTLRKFESGTTQMLGVKATPKSRLTEIWPQMTRKQNRLNCTLKIIEEVSTDFYRCHQTIRGQLEIVTFSATQADSAGLASSVLPTAAAGSGISMPAFFPPILMREIATKIITIA